MPRTLAPAPIDYRPRHVEALASALPYPDLGVDESLFVWARSLNERVAHQRREEGS
jgi:hypothetical protein